MKANQFIMPVLLAGVAMPGMAMAQTGQALQVQSDDQDIIITATRREERLQDVPISVTAISGQSLEQQSIESVNDLSRGVPSLTVRNHPGDNSTATLSLRGLGVQDSTISLDPTVGLYFDGVYLGRSTGGNLGFLDVARVEVLRGPQGTLFGRNTVGGAISIVSKTPTNEFEGYVGGGFGNYSSWNVEGVLNIPITDGVAARFAGRHTERDGFARSSITGVELNSDNSEYIRGQVQIRPTNSLRILLSGDYSQSRNGGQWVTLVAFNPTGSFAFESSLTNYVPVADPFDRNPASNTLCCALSEVWGLSATVDWDFGPGQFRLISAYREVERTTVLTDLDGTPALGVQAGIQGFGSLVDQNQTSHELQYFGTSFDDRLSWIAGAYYFREEGVDLGTAQFLALATDFGGNPACPGNAVGLLDGCPAAASITEGFAVNKSTSLFAQIGFEIVSGLTIDVGLRQVWDRRRLTLFSRAVQPVTGNVLSCSVAGALVADGCEAVTPGGRYSYLPFTVGLNYRVNSEVLVYAKFSRGYRAGGINIRGQTTEALNPFGPERADTFEAGVKSDLFNRLLRFNAAVFSTDYTDVQLSAIISGGGQGAAVTTSILNAGTARIRGFEVESVLRLGDFTLSGSLSHIDPEYTQIASSVPASVVTLASSFSLVSRWQWNLAASYNARIGPHTLRLRAGYDWRSETTFANIPPAHPSNTQPSYGLFNASATFEMRNGLEFQLWAANLFDEEYIVVTSNFYNSLGFTPGYPGAPRTYGLNVRYRF